jgi:hypothetical protein
MAFITADRVKDTSTTTGTGNITVSGSAPFGYRTFSTVLSVGDTFYYAIQGQSTAEWEIGVGTYASTNQFSRTTVLASSASGSAVSFSSGTKNVFITLAAAKTLQLGPSDGPTAGSVPYGTGSTLAYSAVGTSGQVLQSNGAGAPTWVSAGTGTVTSVNVSGGTTGLTASGGPVTSSGTITLAGTLAIANGGTNSTATPTAGTIPYGTGTAIAYSPTGTSGQVLTSGGSGAPTWTTVTGTGTVTSVNVSGGTTGLTYSGGPVTASGTITMAGTLGVANGGTGLTTTPANGALDIGNGTGFTRTTLTAGTNITITNSAGGISIASTGGGTPGGSTTQIQYNNAGAFAGSSNLTFDGTNLTSGGTVSMASSFKRNILINGNFLVNQRGYVTGTATASGTYMHDRWKSTTTNSNYTFTQGTPDTTITIAAGTIAQIVEDKNVAGGVYTLSWTGTATARIAINGGTTSGSYAASPITTSSATAGQTITVEFSTGTLGKVQLEPGAIATPYERQIYTDQLAQCQRYYTTYTVSFRSYCLNGDYVSIAIYYSTRMRIAPTAARSGGTFSSCSFAAVENINVGMCRYTLLASSSTMVQVVDDVVTFSAEL